MEAEFQHAFRVACERVEQVASSGRAFYIGITEHPQHRFGEHVGLNSAWKSMRALVEAPTSNVTARLERLLIRRFRGSLMLANIGDGGERASSGSPHFLYVLFGGCFLRHR